MDTAHALYLERLIQNVCAKNLEKWMRANAGAVCI